MARGDKKGPLGQGKMTGRGMGYCAGHGTPGYLNPGYSGGSGFGRGSGRGFGGHGYRHGFNATGMSGRQRAAMGMPLWGPGAHEESSQENELESLRERVQKYEEGLDEIRGRMDALDKDK